MSRDGFRADFNSSQQYLMSGQTLNKHGRQNQSMVQGRNTGGNGHMLRSTFSAHIEHPKLIYRPMHIVEDQYVPGTGDPVSDQGKPTFNARRRVFNKDLPDWQDENELFVRASNKDQGYTLDAGSLYGHAADRSNFASTDEYRGFGNVPQSFSDHDAMPAIWDDASGQYISLQSPHDHRPFYHLSAMDMESEDWDLVPGGMLIPGTGGQTTAGISHVVQVVLVDRDGTSIPIITLCFRKAEDALITELDGPFTDDDDMISFVDTRSSSTMVEMPADSHLELRAASGESFTDIGTRLWRYSLSIIGVYPGWIRTPNTGWNESGQFSSIMGHESDLTIADLLGDNTKIPWLPGNGQISTLDHKHYGRWMNDPVFDLRSDQYLGGEPTTDYEEVRCLFRETRFRSVCQVMFTATLVGYPTDYEESSEQPSGMSSMSSITISDLSSSGGLTSSSSSLSTTSQSSLSSLSSLSSQSKSSFSTTSDGLSDLSSLSSVTISGIDTDIPP